MKMSEIKSMTLDEIKTKLASLEEELFNIKFQSSITNAPKPIAVRNIKKDIARLNTALNLQK